jgi:hypothetical protein
MLAIMANLAAVGAGSAFVTIGTTSIAILKSRTRTPSVVLIALVIGDVNLGINFFLLWLLTERGGWSFLLPDGEPRLLIRGVFLTIDPASDFPT